LVASSEQEKYTRGQCDSQSEERKLRRMRKKTRIGRGGVLKAESRGEKRRGEVRLGNTNSPPRKKPGKEGLMSAKK